jgi:hypothetical protein
MPLKTASGGQGFQPLDPEIESPTALAPPWNPTFDCLRRPSA